MSDAADLLRWLDAALLHADNAIQGVDPAYTSQTALIEIAAARMAIEEALRNEEGAVIHPAIPGVRGPRPEVVPADESPETMAWHPWWHLVSETEPPRAGARIRMELDTAVDTLELIAASEHIHPAYLAQTALAAIRKANPDG